MVATRWRRSRAPLPTTQINIEYNLSYIYHSMSCFFNRDGARVTPPGPAICLQRSKRVVQGAR